MTVKELITLLQKEDQEKIVVCESEIEPRNSHIISLVEKDTIAISNDPYMDDWECTSLGDMTPEEFLEDYHAIEDNENVTPPDIKEAIVLS